jgi:hypothetical protein
VVVIGEVGVVEKQAGEGEVGVSGDGDDVFGRKGLVPG